MQAVKLVPCVHVHAVDLSLAIRATHQTYYGFDPFFFFRPPSPPRQEHNSP